MLPFMGESLKLHLTKLDYFEIIFHDQKMYKVYRGQVWTCQQPSSHILQRIVLVNMDSIYFCKMLVYVLCNISFLNVIPITDGC